MHVTGKLWKGKGIGDDGWVNEGKKKTKEPMKNKESKCLPSSGSGGVLKNRKLLN